MGRIRILSDLVANQIAAGEVVERPASVVKELLENSLDAGATRIRIEIEGGGRKLIRIADNGHGMVKDDALLAFERHATSKLRTSDDLLSIATLGFRGEALPSIASVSRLMLETRAAEDDSGTLLEIAGGNIQRVEEAGLPAGTTITVRDLFFNTPARRKFLRSEQTELSHIAALVMHYALAHPGKHFELHSATQALLTTASSGINTIADLKGKKVGVQTDTTGEIYGNKMAKKYGYTTVTFDDYALEVNAVKAGNVDAAINDNGVLYDFVKNNPDTKVAQEFNTGEQYGFAAEKDDPNATKLMNMFNSVLDQAKQDGTMDKIYKKWFGQVPGNVNQ